MTHLGPVGRHIVAILANDYSYLNQVSPKVFTRPTPKSTTTVSVPTRVPRQQTKYDPYIGTQHSTFSCRA